MGRADPLNDMEHARLLLQALVAYSTPRGSNGVHTRRLRSSWIKCPDVLARKHHLVLDKNQASSVLILFFVDANALRPHLIYVKEPQSECSPILPMLALWI